MLDRCLDPSDRFLIDQVVTSVEAVDVGEQHYLLTGFDPGAVIKQIIDGNGGALGNTE